MQTRAKFYVAGVDLLPGKDSGVEVRLSAVSRGDRNAEWATATPVGNITMTINNPAAADAWIAFQTTARDTGKSPEVFIDIYPSTTAGPATATPSALLDPEGIYGHNGCGECGMEKDADITRFDPEARWRLRHRGRARPTRTADEGPALQERLAIHPHPVSRHQRQALRRPPLGLRRSDRGFGLHRLR